MRPTSFEPLACPDELLEPFLDGDLDDRDRLTVAAHLERCARCRSELDRARDVRDALRRQDRLECPPALVEGVLAAARSESTEGRVDQRFAPSGPTESAARSPEVSGAPPTVLWLAAAAVVVAVAFGVLMARSLFDLSSAMPQTASTVPPAETSTGTTTAPATGLGPVTEPVGLGTDSETAPSPVEVARAEREARLAMALFAQLSDRVGDIVEREVIGRRVSAAPSAALDAIRERKE